jgi:hypothetical protein
MTPRPVEDVLGDIAQGFADRCPAGWTSGRIVCRQAGSVSEYEADATMSDGSIRHPTRLSRTLGPHFDELRDLFARPGRGTWFTARCTLTPGGRVVLDLDYDHEPEWRTPIAAGHYLEDRTRYPRDPARTPPWLAARLQEAQT